MDLPDAHITRDALLFDGVKVPGVIDRAGITVKPGDGSGVNIIKVTFVVAGVYVDDPTQG